MKKDIYIGLITPWGIPLVEKTLQNWSDVDINGFMELHRFLVYSSKEESRGRHYFKLVRASTYIALREEIEKMNIQVEKIKGITLIDHWSILQENIPLDFMIPIKRSFIDMQKYLYDNEDCVLVVNESESKNVIINLTGVSPYRILFFDKDSQFKGASFSIEEGLGEFRMTTSFKYLLFVKTNIAITLENLKTFQFN